MGILSSVSTDIEDLVLDGYDDDYIALSIGIDKVVIQPFINHFRYKHNIHLEPKKKNYYRNDSVCM